MLLVVWPVSVGAAIPRLFQPLLAAVSSTLSPFRRCAKVLLVRLAFTPVYVMAALLTVLAMTPSPTTTSSLVYYLWALLPHAQLLVWAPAPVVVYAAAPYKGAGFTCSPRLHTSTRHGRPTDGTCHDLFSNYY